MSKVDIFMPIFIGDYLKDTRRLSTEEHGAYLLLMFDYWQNGNLPNDDRLLSRIAGMDSDAWSIASSNVKSFFKQEGDLLVHSRIDRELEKAKGKKVSAVERAKKAAKARWGNGNAPSTDEALLGLCPSPSPSPLPLKLESSEVGEIFSYYNSRRGNMAEAIKLTSKRRSAINARIEDYGKDCVIKAIDNAASSDFLQGKTDRPFSCGLDWIFNPNNFAKIIEGQYKNKKTTPPNTKKPDGLKTVKDDYAGMFGGKSCQ